MTAFATDAERAANIGSLRSLASQITELAGHLNAGNHRFLMLIAEFDRRNGWSDGATQSCAHWLNWKCGIDIGAARQKVRVAHALVALPKISAAMARGELSYSKVRALTRVACERTEDYFLMIALHGTAHHVETMVRHYRRAKDAEELSREAQQQANRYFRFHYDDDGSLVFKGSMPAVPGALFLKALQSAINEMPSSEAESADVSPQGFPLVTALTPSVKSPIAARRADALGLLAESFVENGSAALSGGDRNLITVHVSAETLRHKTAGCCEIDEGPSISAETARRLACDASVVALIEDEDGEPLNVGRKTRTISAPLRRFLNTRDKGCRFPGCVNTKFVDGHHVKHWADGGETKPSNLVSLCRFHHRKVHEGAVVVQILDDGAFRFVQPNGQAFDSVPNNQSPSLTDWTHLLAEHAAHGIVINARTAVTRWAGESCDYGLGVEVLLQHAERSGKTEGVPGGT